MAVGISATNELDEEAAKRHLHSWLKYHPDYNTIENVSTQDQLDFVEIENAFNIAHASNPQDTQVMLALGVLMFIQRNYPKAQEYFTQAIREDPTNHSFWNKYGAALAQQMKSEESIKAYEQALDLRPNYVRTIVNLGLSYGNQGNNEQASKHFINALVLNPSLDHVKTFLQGSFIKMKRFDLVEKLKGGDYNVFRDDFPDIIDAKNMPSPSIDRLYEHDIMH